MLDSISRFKPYTMSPEVIVSLTPLDHLPPRNYTASVFYISLKPGLSPVKAFQVLQEGLHETFAQLPWLGGTVREQSARVKGWRPGQLEIRYEPLDIKGPRPSQLRFNHMSTCLSYDDLRESAFPNDTFEDKDLTWAPFMPDISNGCEVFVAQANFLPGGLIITAGLHHAAGDGNSSFLVINRWADWCKYLQNGGTPPAPPQPEFSDRKLHDKVWAKEGTGQRSLQIDPEVWKLLGLEYSDTDLLLQSSHAQSPKTNSHHERRKEPGPDEVDKHQWGMQSAIFYISPTQFTALQRDCVHGISATASISATHAICGLIWRCVMKAHSAMIVNTKRTGLPTESGETARLDVLLDGRSGFSHSLPQMYLGNHTFHLQSLIDMTTLTSPHTSVASVAGTICENMSRVNSAKLLDMYTLLRDMPDYEALQRRKWQPQMKSMSGLRMMITSMLMIPSDLVSFGDGVFGNRGKPDGVRVLMGAFNQSGTRLCFVLPRRTNGAVEFIVNLYPEEMDVLLADEEFQRYAMFLA